MEEKSKWRLVWPLVGLLLWVATFWVVTFQVNETVSHPEGLDLFPVYAFTLMLFVAIPGLAVGVASVRKPSNGKSWVLSTGMVGVSLLLMAATAEEGGAVWLWALTLPAALMPLLSLRWRADTVHWSEQDTSRS